MKIEKGRKKRKYESPKGRKIRKRALFLFFYLKNQWLGICFFDYIRGWSFLYIFYTCSLPGWIYRRTGIWYLGPEVVNNLVRKSLVTRSLDLFWKLAVDLWGRRDIHFVWVPEWRSVINTCIPLSARWGDPLQYWFLSINASYIPQSRKGVKYRPWPCTARPNAC